MNFLINIYIVYHCIYVYMYMLYIYMVIDLKVLVKSCNCEDRSYYVGNPHESSFSSTRKFLFNRLSPPITSRP